MSDLLQLVVSEGASDLHIRFGCAPTIRVTVFCTASKAGAEAGGFGELMRSITSRNTSTGA